MKRLLADGAILAALTAFGAPVAYAQETGGSDGDSRNDGASDTVIIVTAQRRAENIEAVPVAIEYVSSEELAEQNITSELDLPFVAPGLLIRAGTGGNELNFSLRGQSIDQFAGTRPGVLPYFNEVQVSTNTGGGSGTSAFYDLESIQVLKGPQGTLFGRNATGGAVLFTTARPTNRFEGFASARYGNYDHVQIQGAINFPIVDDTLLVRVAGFYGDQTGFQRNLFDRSRPGDLERYGVRGSVTVRAGGFENRTVVDYYQAEGSSIQGVLFALDPNQPQATPATFLYSPLADLALGPGAWDGYLAARGNNPLVPVGGLADFLPIQQANGPFVVTTNDANDYRAENLIITNHASAELSDSAELRYIMGYANLDTFLRGDSDGSPFGIAGGGEITEIRTPGQFSKTDIFSNELQITGTAFDGALTYTSGLYYAHERTDLRRQSTFLDLFGGVLTINEWIKSNDTYAAYGQATYEFDNGFGVTAGLRYTSEDAKLFVLPASTTVATPAQLATGMFDNTQEREMNNWSWTFGAQYQGINDLNLYAVTRRSHRNGGFNGDQPPGIGGADVVGNRFDTETLTDIELGAKFFGDIASVPVRINLALYYLWVDDGQRNAFASINGTPSSLAINVPETEVYGFEIDGMFDLTDWLTIGGALNYTHARFTDGTAIVNGVPTLFATVPDTPEWSGTFYGQISLPVGDRFEFSLRGDAYSQSSTFFTSSGNLNPTARLPSYTVANFRVGIEDLEAGWSLSANLRNAFDETYFVGGIALAQLLQYNTATPGAPRTYSIEARFSF